MITSKKPRFMRLTTFFTALALMFTLFGLMPEGTLRASAYTDSSGTYWYYSIGGAIAVGGTWEPEWKAKILSCTPGSSKDVTVPAEVPDDQGGMHTVTAIGYDAGHGRGAFEDKNVTSVSLPSTVTSIEKLAFHNCSKLTDITMSNAITSIGDNAFEGCSVLTGINMPSSLKTIGISAFNGCSSLKRIDLPDTVTSLKRECFESCTALESVRLSNNLTEIPERAFAVCKNIKSLYIPDGVTKIGSYAFSNMSSLKAIYLPKETTEINSVAFYKTNSAVIYGYKGSAAETYAAENSLDFVDVDALLSDVTYTIKPKLSSKIIKPESLNAGVSLSGVADGTEIRMGAGGTYEGKAVDSMKCAFYVNVTSYSGTTKLSTSTPTGVTVTVEGDSFTAKLPDTLDTKAVIDKVIENAGKGYTSVLSCDVEVTPTYVDNYVPTGMGTFTIYFGEDDSPYFDFGESNFAEAFKATLYALDKSGRIIKNGSYYDINKDGKADIHLSNNILFMADTRSVGGRSDTLTLTKQEEEYAKEYYSAMTPAEQKAAHATYMNTISFVFPELDAYEPKNLGTLKIDLTSGSFDTKSFDAAQAAALQSFIGIGTGMGDIFADQSLKKIDLDEKGDSFDLEFKDVNTITVLDTSSINGNYVYAFPQERLNDIIDSAASEERDYYLAIELIFPEKSSRIPGDATGDGKVNIADVIRIQQKLAGWKVKINESNSDVTGDGKVNIADVIRIQQKLAGWKVTLK